jgi:hypothetical protein
MEKTVAAEPTPPVEDLDTKPRLGQFFFSTKNPISEAFKSKRMMEARLGRDGHCTSFENSSGIVAQITSCRPRLNKV